MQLTILQYRIYIHPTNFVPRSGIEPLPIACKTITLPLRQRGKFNSKLRT